MLFCFNYLLTQTRRVNLMVPFSLNSTPARMQGVGRAPIINMEIGRRLLMYAMPASLARSGENYAGYTANEKGERFAEK
jgi:hypothetical protein